MSSAASLIWPKVLKISLRCSPPTLRVKFCTMTRQTIVLALGGVASRLRAGEPDLDFPPLAGERERDFFLSAAAGERERDFFLSAAGERERDFFLAGAGERERAFFLSAAGERERDFFASPLALVSDLPLGTGELVGDRELDRDGILTTQLSQHAPQSF